MSGGQFESGAVVVKIQIEAVKEVELSQKWGDSVGRDKRTARFEDQVSDFQQDFCFPCAGKRLADALGLRLRQRSERDSEFRGHKIRECRDVRAGIHNEFPSNEFAVRKQIDGQERIWNVARVGPDDSIGEMERSKRLWHRAGILPSYLQGGHAAFFGPFGSGSYNRAHGP